MNEKQMKEIFLTIALFAHGYASIIANHLERAYRGAILASQEEGK